MRQTHPAGAGCLSLTGRAFESFLGPLALSASVLRMWTLARADGHREIAALPGAEVLELRVLAPVCTGLGRPSAGHSFCLCKFLLPPSSHVASRCIFPVSLFLFTRQDRYDCGPPTPFNSPAQEVPQQRTHGPSERVTPVLT